MLCLIAKLDDAATAKLNAIRKAALSDNERGKQVYGHITLASYTGEQETAFACSCRELLADTPDFEIVYEKVEVLKETRIIVARPGHSETLTTLHRRIAEKHGDDLDPWTKAERWYPHTTLVNADQIACGASRTIFALISSLFLEIHKVFLRKSAFIRTQILSGFALADLIIVYLVFRIRCGSGADLQHHGCTLFSLSCKGGQLRAVPCPARRL